jgi:hypothetical protein
MGTSGIAMLLLDGGCASLVTVMAGHSVDHGIRGESLALDPAEGGHGPTR